MEIRHFKTKSEILSDWARRQIKDTGQSVMRFSRELSEHYTRITPEGSRSAPLDEVPEDGTVDDHLRIEKKNALNVERWIKLSGRIPIDVVDAWILTLHGKYRTGCVNDLLAATGFVACEAGAQPDAATLAKTMQAAADILKPLARIAADGVVDHNDIEHITEARELFCVLAGQLAGWEWLFKQVKPAA